MKKLIIILAAFFLIGCKSDNPQIPNEPVQAETPATVAADPAPVSEPEPAAPEPANPATPDAPRKPDKPETPAVNPKPETVTVTVETPQSEPVTVQVTVNPAPEPEPIKKTVKFASIGQQIKFFDGFAWTATNYEKRGGKGVYMQADQIYTLDQYGQTASMIYAPEPADLLKKTSAGLMLCDVMPPAESSSLGAMARTYSQVHQFDGATWAEPVHWSTQQWQCSEIIETDSGEVLIKDTLGAYHTQSGKTGIFTANEGGLLIANYDSVNRRADFYTQGVKTPVQWATNYLAAARDWVELGGVYYSHNGYEFTPGAGLEESANALSGFATAPYPVALPNGETHTMLHIGADDALNVVYWLECNTGWLVELRVATNQLSITRRLYVGDGMKTNGIALQKSLHPLFVDGVIYYLYQSNMLYLDLKTNGAGVYLAEQSILKEF